MPLQDHLKQLGDLAELVCAEAKAARTLLACERSLSAKEEEMIAASLAAGVAQLAMLRLPLLAECCRLEQVNAGVEA